MNAERPFSASAERNREPILGVLREVFATSRRVLEIGSGTGQHAVHFAAGLPGLQWQPTDRPDQLAGIEAWRAAAGLPNLRPAQALDVNRPADWQALHRVEPEGFDAVYSANTLHIMSWPEVERLFAGLPPLLAAQARVVIYGPFRIGGGHTSPSNAAFDRALREAVPHRGVRDLEAVDALARAAGLHLQANHPMPANNRCVVFVMGAPGDPGSRHSRTSG